jgi:sortase A
MEREKDRSMRRSSREEIGGTLTLPLGLGRRRRARQRRPRRTAIGALVLLGATLLAMGLYLPAKAVLAQRLLNRAWVATQRDHDAIARPWPWADTWPVARLTLPGARAPLTVLAGASGRNLAFAPTLLDGSAAPGTPGVTVIAGHRDTHFRSLQALAVGDEFTLERPDGETLRYTVASLDVIDSDTEALRLDAEQSLVALVTCWPFDAVTPGGSLRYVVTGVPAQSASASRNTLASINTASSARERGALARSRAR